MTGSTGHQKIVVIDYGLGNLLSVVKAFEEVAGRNPVLVTGDPGSIREASHIVLPGAGNFKTGMENLYRQGLADVLEEEILGRGKPFLGICLGMQLLAERGEEFGEHRGLGFISGRTRKLRSNGLPLPHIGWQDIERIKDTPLLEGRSSKKDYYFVHSFVLECPGEYVTAYCTYGEQFPAAIQKDNIMATQFHPEKSREAGLDILRNFLRGIECSRSDWFLSSC